MSALPDLITIGELAARSGVATSALRFYETRGLISSIRTAGNQRRFPRAALRRVAVIQAAQRVGLSLDEVGAALATLPPDHTPTRGEWARMSQAWRRDLDHRIAQLEKLRDDLTGCIGCGCLSLRLCSLVNRDDEAATKGPGARGLRV